MNAKQLSHRVAAGLLALILVVQVSWHLASAAAAAGSETAMAAPDFELPDLSGTKIKLSTFKGNRAVLVYFWATWCPYCLAAKPQVAKIRETFPGSDLEILAINVGGGDSLERIQKFQKGHPSNYPVLFDESGKVTKSYQVQGIPLFVLINKSGNIVYRANELPAAAEIKQYLQQ